MVSSITGDSIKRTGKEAAILDYANEEYYVNKIAIQGTQRASGQGTAAVSHNLSIG